MARPEHSVFRLPRRRVLVEVFLAAYPSLCQEAAGRLRTLHNPADYPPVDEVRPRFTFSWRYVSYGVPEQLREISARMFQTERDKAVQAMSEPAPKSSRL
jgi:hypothetical protein